MEPGLKKRLLGAAVLIVLAVIFVPMLLPNREGSGQQSTSLKIPPEPGGEMQTRVLKVGPGTASAGSSTAAAITDPDRVATLAVAASAAQPATQPGASAPQIAATTPPLVSAPVGAAAGQPATAPAPVVVANAAAPSVAAPSTNPRSDTQPVAGGPGAAAHAVYSINLGIFAEHGSAAKLVAAVKQHGFTAVATPETFKGKPVQRVRVGPFASRAKAEAARLQLKGVVAAPMLVETGVIDQHGDAPATALAAGQAGAWAVQLGAFSDRATADKLRERLRAQGFDGYVDGINASSGKLWRVRAGPFASHAAADAARGQIADQLKVPGAIVTQR